MIRLSAIPSHFSTAVFATCNVKFLYFFIATFLSLPKQIFLVYLGVLLVQKKESNVGKNLMFGAVFVVTVVLGIWIWLKMAKVKKLLLEEQAQRREKALTAEMQEADRMAAERRVPVSEPQAVAAFGAPGRQMQVVPPPEYAARGGWGMPEQQQHQGQYPPPARAF